ncbi:MAG: type IV toxin-antitoxin system AbiEi family antitoxin domain-containing protein [Actinomycetota bacterium]
MHRLEPEIAEIAASQHGLVTSSQLAELGVGRALPARRCQSGQWRAAAPGVFAIAGSPRTFHQRVLTAQLAAGPGALISHRTALLLWQVRPATRIPIEVCIPRGRSHSRPGVIVHESRDLHLARPEVIDGIAVTGLARSLLDLGAVLPGGVRKAVWAARRTHDLAWGELLSTLALHGRQGRSGVGPLRVVVSQHYGEVAGDSATEDHAYALLDDSVLVPRPERQIPIRCADGVVVTVDLGWPGHRVLVEIDGVDHLTNEDLQQKDRHRRNQLEIAGYTVLNYTGRLLRECPDQFVRDARDMLVRAGYT